MQDSKARLFGIFAERTACEQAADELIASGFSPADLSVLDPEMLTSPAASNDGNSANSQDSASSLASGASALGSLGVPEGEAARFEARLRHGGILFSAHCDSARQIEPAKRILTRNGAEEIVQSTAVPGDADQFPAAKRAAGA